MPSCHPNRELDDALCVGVTGADTVADARTGKNGRHRLARLGTAEFTPPPFEPGPAETDRDLFATPFSATLRDGASLRAQLAVLAAFMAPEGFSLAGRSPES
jgi:hypothetical protein